MVRYAGLRTELELVEQELRPKSQEYFCLWNRNLELRLFSIMRTEQAHGTGQKSGTFVDPPPCPRSPAVSHEEDPDG